MHTKSKLTVLLLLVAPLAAHAGTTGSLSLGDAKAGEKLHGQFCTACHTSTIYTRPNHSVKSYGGLVGRVGGCSAQLKLDLSREQINDLTAYLNSNFYKFNTENPEK